LILFDRVAVGQLFRLSGSILSVPDQVFDQIQRNSEQEPPPEGDEDSDEHQPKSVQQRRSYFPETFVLILRLHLANLALFMTTNGGSANRGPALQQTFAMAKSYVERIEPHKIRGPWPASIRANGLLTSRPESPRVRQTAKRGPIQGNASMLWIINTWLLMVGLCLHWIDEAEEGPWN
jgi:hypothetical protein